MISANALRTYPSKIMLAGEYGVVVEGSALTVPFQKFSTRVRHVGEAFTGRATPPGREPDVEMSRKVLQDIYAYLEGLPPNAFHAAPDLELFNTRQREYWFDSDIPVGYGLGSSGTVSAAVYDLFFPAAGKIPLVKRKEDLALIESFFHGKSSGVDALTCHTGVPLHFENGQTIRTVELDLTGLPGGYRFFLLDSGEKFDTGPLVRHFLEQMKDPGYESVIREEYLPLNDRLIEALLGRSDADIGLLVRLVSDFQFNHFRKMIPDHMTDAWIEGQVSNDYYLKLNGSGGGFMLGVAHHTVMGTLEERWGKDLVWIS
ncbi:MAG TPA: hypothetical protein ENO20_12990 [Bacteroides sp.]|nr:hypothetical protein [Bacteroides sp.]